MSFRVISFLLLLMICTSCKYFTSNNDNSTQILDTIVDFSSVDVSPSFKICEKFIDEARTNCFRENMQLIMAKHLKNLEITSETEVEGVIIVVVKIDQKGNPSLKKVFYPELFVEKKLTFDEQVRTAIEKLPTLNPAIKREIPVTTEYKLPIKISIQ